MSVRTGQLYRLRSLCWTVFNSICFPLRLKSIIPAWSGSATLRPSDQVSVCVRERECMYVHIHTHTCVHFFFFIHIRKKKNFTKKAFLFDFNELKVLTFNFIFCLKYVLLFLVFFLFCIKCLMFNFVLFLLCIILFYLTNYILYNIYV